MIGRTLLVIVALGAAAIAAGATWGARSWWFEHVDRPALVREQEAICRATVEAVAQRATLAEQLRQFQVGEQATQRFLQQQAAEQADDKARKDVMEMEIRSYEKRLAETGRRCAIDGDDLVFLGLQLKPGGDLSGGGRAGQGAGPGPSTPVSP